MAAQSDNWWATVRAEISAASKDPSSPRALVSTAVFAMVAVVLAAQPLGLPWGWSAATTLLAPLVVLCAWSLLRWRLRRMPSFKPNQAGILVAFQWTGPTDRPDWVEGTLRALREELAARASRVTVEDGRELAFVVRGLHRSRRIDSDDTAREMVRATGARLLIWATVIAGRNGLHVPVIKTCVSHKSLDQRKKMVLGRAMQEAWDGIDGLTVGVDTDLGDISRTSALLNTAATYQMGLAAAASGRGDTAAALFQEIVGSGGTSKRYERRARRELSLIKVAPWVGGESWPVPGVDKDSLVAPLKAAESALLLDNKNVFAHGLKASVLFLSGDEQGARKATKSVKNIAAEMSNMNEAVFALKKGNFDNALMFYKRAHKASSTFDHHGGAVVWLQAAVREWGPTFEFGLAYVLDYSSRRPEALPHWEAALTQPLQSKARAYAEGRVAELRGASQGSP